MRAWLQSLAPRERAIVLGGAGVVLIVLVYLLAVEPALRAFEVREQRVEALERELEWMRSAAAELEALGGAAAATGGSGRPPYLAVDRALREAGLPRPRTLEPVGAEGARLELEDVSFDALVRVLARLRAREALAATRAGFRRSGLGRVDARVTLERAR